MKLDFNFNEKTHLRQWWKQVYGNFAEIEKEFNQNEDIWLNACTKDQAREYISELAGGSAQLTAALEEFKAALEENGEAAAGINTIMNKRLPFENSITDVNSPDLSVAGVYTGVFENTPGGLSGSVVTLNDTQLFIPDGDSKKVYRRSGYSPAREEWASDWMAIDADLWAQLGEDRSDIEKKQDKVVFGTYNGDGTTDRFFDLGFTPRAVEVFKKDGSQVIVWADQYYHYGGFAVSGGNCETYAGVLLSISEGGFNVHSGTGKDASVLHVNCANNNGAVYYYKAYA
ncbi:MAG: hypothetical protein PUF72_10015 [Clostridiales bacterium]|nr:hypothetical protein [Clostridiales bacterium]